MGVLRDLVVFLPGNEAYVIQGTVTDDNKVLLAAVQKSVESFQVLNNTVFQAVKNGVSSFRHRRRARRLRARVNRMQIQSSSR